MERVPLASEEEFFISNNAPSNRTRLHRTATKAWRRLWNAVWTITLLLLPSFLRNNPKNTTLSAPKTSTEFLNGLRGLASFTVYMGHLITPLCPELLAGYGQLTSSNIMQLPFARLLYSGTAMVAIFFIVSGFVLSKKAFAHCAAGEYQQTFHVLASSLFKRGFRLFIPTTIATFLIMLACRAHLFEDPLLEEFHTRRPIRLESWLEQIWDWLAFVNSFVLNPLHFWPVDTSHYGAHLWTISILYSCSIYLFATIIGLSRLSPRSFTVVAAILIIYNLCANREPLGLTYFGMMLAHIRSRPRPLQMKSSSGMFSKLEVLAAAATILGLYLASYPVESQGVAFGYLDSWFDIRPLTYYSVGGMATMSGLLYQPLFQKVFSSGLPVYLGKISLSLWIIHEPLLQLFGWKFVFGAFNAPEMHQQPAVFRYMAVLCSWLVLTTVMILVADLFWRCVEVPCRDFTDWLHWRLFTPLEIKHVSLEVV